VYVVDASTTLFAFAPNCDPLWSYPLSDPHVLTGNVQSPTVGPDGKIYVGSPDHYLYAVNPDGTLHCRFPTGGWIQSTPAIATDGTVYVSQGLLYALNPDCSEKWRFPPGSGPLQSTASPVIDADGTIYWRHSFEAYAVNPDGTEKWSVNVTGGSTLVPSGAIGADDTLYLGSGYLSGPGGGSGLTAIGLWPPMPGCVTYTSSDVPKAIPNPGTITSTLNVGDGFTLADVNVGPLNITHTWDEDLDVFLVSPQGTRVELFTDVGGSNDNFTNTVLDDEYALPVSSRTAPFTGRFRPEGLLSALDGQSSAGVWTLEITDDTPVDSGTLQSWQLELCRTCTGPDADADCVPDDTDNCPLDYNPGQENADAAIDNGPGIPGDDSNLPNAVADSEGDACETDGDIDNDGLPDSQDINPLGATGICAAFAGADDGHPNPAGGDVTDDDDHDGDPALPTGGDTSDNGPSWDTDNDGALDGVECTLGHNPRERTERPNTADCGGAGDTDGDGLKNAWETCGWGTSPTVVDSDGDGKGDCKEAADVNGDGLMNFVGDTIYYAKAVLLPRDQFGKTMDFDIDKNGLVDFVGDVMQEARFALITGLCK
jgi:subtilisin-like proprotein convertase family protein